MSNCINSGIRKVYVLTQFNSFYLNGHLSRTYNFGNGVNFGGGFAEVSYWLVVFPERVRFYYLLGNDFYKLVLRNFISEAMLLILPGLLLASKISYLQMPVLLPNGTWYIKTMYTEKGSMWCHLYENHL